MKRLASLWGPVLAWCGLIYLFSSFPDLSSGLGYDYPLRKAAHLTEYAVLWVLLRRAWAGSGWPRADAAALGLAALYAVSDEWHQTFVPGRAGTPADVALDALGAFLALTTRRVRAML